MYPNFTLWPLAGLLLLALSACDRAPAPAPESTEEELVAAETPDNPFFAPSGLPYQLPPFDRIKNEHYVPAFERGMAEQAAEIAAIADNPEPPTFDNTIVAMEKSGALLERTSRVFFNLVGADTNDTLEAVQAEMAPKLAAHQDAILLNPKLYQRIKTLYDSRHDLGLNAEAIRLLERYHTDFVRAGAELAPADQERLKAINAELATLQTQFSQNVLKEVNRSAIVVDNREDLVGLSENQIAAAGKAAEERGLPGKYVIALMNTSGQPVLANLQNRDLRRRILETSLGRGSSGGEYDNREVLSKIIKLRAERAQLLGYPNHAAYVLEDETARTTGAVNDLLSKLAPAAVANARREAADLQAVIDAEGGGFELAPWDWDYYAEKVRKARFDFDESELKPYLELNSVLENGVFYAANKLYGLTFKRRTDLPVYRDGVMVYEVFDADGSPLALFLGDYYARPSKRGGAWMNAYVPQSGLFGSKPVVANHLNIPEPPKGEPTLLTFDEVTTMFHEFGHALHGMFSDVYYPRFAGTSVPRDFVEYPSQVNEMWATWPEVLANYARHYQTGDPLPQIMIDKVLAAEKFNQGYATTEYLAATLLDQSWHQLPPDQIPDAEGLLDFEAQTLENAGVAFKPVPPRYRSTYFSHIIGGYSAGYYSYIWSEVLDADSVEWFKENGGLKRENGDHFRRTLLSKGGSAEAMDLFRNFRGRDPDIRPLLERRGLTAGG